MRTEADRTPPGRRWVSAEALLQRASAAEVDYEARFWEPANDLDELIEAATSPTEGGTR